MYTYITKLLLQWFTIQYYTYVVGDEEMSSVVRKDNITTTIQPHNLYGPQVVELIMRKPGMCDFYYVDILLLFIFQ